MINENFSFDEDLLNKLKKHIHIGDKIEQRKSDIKWIIDSMSTKPLLKKRVEEVVFKEFEVFPFFKGLSEGENHKYDVLYWLTDLLQQQDPIKKDTYIFKQGNRIEKLFFILDGEVSYVLNYMDTIYFKQKTGSILGLEDYIYRLPEEVRFALNDQVYFFTDHEIKIWYKRKFKLKTTQTTTMYAIKVQDMFPELQKRFPTVADRFFSSQLKNLTNLLYCKLKTSYKIMKENK